jgi:hypothetical protein
VVRLYLRLEAVTGADDRGIRTDAVHAQRSESSDRRPGSLARARSRDREKADPRNPGEIAVPMAGVVTLTVEMGERVEVGRQIGTIEAMKMETAISAQLPEPSSAWPSPRVRPSSRATSSLCSNRSPAACKEQPPARGSPGLHAHL